MTSDYAKTRSVYEEQQQSPPPSIAKRRKKPKGGALPKGFEVNLSLKNPNQRELFQKVSNFSISCFVNPKCPLIKSKIGLKNCVCWE